MTFEPGQLACFTSAFSALVSRASNSVIFIVARELTRVPDDLNTPVTILVCGSGKIQNVKAWVLDPI